MLGRRWRTCILATFVSPHKASNECNKGEDCHRTHGPNEPALGRKVALLTRHTCEPKWQRETVLKDSHFVSVYLRLTVPSSALPPTFYLTENRKNMMDASLRGCSHVLFWLTFPSATTLCLIWKNIRKEKKHTHTHKSTEIQEKQTHTFTTVNNILSMICLYCHLWLEVKSWNSVDYLSPVTRVRIMSS